MGSVGNPNPGRVLKLRGNADIGEVQFADMRFNAGGEQAGFR